MYDPWGRPIVPTQNLQQIPYMQNPQQIQHIQNLENKLKELEQRYNGNNQINTNYIQNSNQTVSPSILLIPVSSEEEAWKYAADWTGAKQYFINEQTNEIYIKWFNANIPETVKEVYKKSEILNTEEIKDNNQEPSISVIDKLNNLETEILNIKELIENGSNANAINLEMDVPKVSGRKSNTKQSDGSGAKGKQSRDGNGRFRSNSKK